MWFRILAAVWWSVCVIPANAAENRFDFAGQVTLSPFVEPGTETLMIIVLDAERQTQ